MLGQGGDQQAMTGGAMGSSIVLEGRRLIKVFGGPSTRPAVDGASIKVAQGTIHGIIGENGAGKSTLLKILFGHTHPDSGQIFLDGKRVRWASPKNASEAGIGMVYQHFQLIDNLTALDNILLGGGSQLSGTSSWWRPVPRKIAEYRISQLLQDIGWHDFPLGQKVTDLSLGIRQRLEILKILFRNARILMMDEPTAVLAPHEIKALLEDLKRLKSRGKTIILVTHKLPEVMAVCDEVTVMRQGSTVAHLATPQTDEAQLASLMVGYEIYHHLKGHGDKTTREQITSEQQDLSRSIDERLLGDQNIPRWGGPDTPQSFERVLPVILSVRQLTIKDRLQKKIVLQDVSFDVRQGEILGIAGVEGNGQTPLVEYLSHPAFFHHFRFGRKRYLKMGGGAFLAETSMDRMNPRKLRAAGVGIIPEDRLHQGLILPMSASENLILGYEDEFYHNGFISPSHLTESWQKALSDFDIRPQDPSIAVGQFSGGNQQKLIVARELGRKPRMILCCHPTRGVDWASSERIYQELFEARDRGAGILLVSSSLDEIFRLSTRIIVFYAGKIVGERQPIQTDQGEIGFMMTGASSSGFNGASQTGTPHA
jgi:ABC-type uncharacterized transport system ATPase subunit